MRLFEIENLKQKSKVKRIETNGWVKKERATIDERKVCIFLQPKAIENKNAINPLPVK